MLEDEEYDALLSLLCRIISLGLRLSSSSELYSSLHLMDNSFLPDTSRELVLHKFPTVGPPKPGSDGNNGCDIRDLATFDSLCSIVPLLLRVLLDKCGLLPTDGSSAVGD